MWAKFKALVAIGLLKLQKRTYFCRFYLFIRGKGVHFQIFEEKLDFWGKFVAEITRKKYKPCHVLQCVGFQLKKCSHKKNPVSYPHGKKKKKTVFRIKNIFNSRWPLWILSTCTYVQFVLVQLSTVRTFQFFPVPTSQNPLNLRKAKSTNCTCRSPLHVQWIIARIPEFGSRALRQCQRQTGSKTCLESEIHHYIGFSGCFVGLLGKGSGTTPNSFSLGKDNARNGDAWVVVPPSRLYRSPRLEIQELSHRDDRLYSQRVHAPPFCRCGLILSYLKT